MQAFARVVETRSFTKATETLHINKPTVTQLVQQLQTRLRVKLAAGSSIFTPRQPPPCCGNVVR